MKRDFVQRISGARLAGSYNVTKGVSMKKGYVAASAVVVSGLALGAFAQQQGAPAAPGKAPKSTTLLFREDFKPGKVGEVQLSQDSLTNPNLLLKVYGPGSKPGDADQSGLLLSNEADPTNPGQARRASFGPVWCRAGCGCCSRTRTTFST